MTTSSQAGRLVPSRTRRLPAQTVPVEGRVIDGDVIRSTMEGRIRNTEFMHQPGDRVTLNGPMREVGQILALLRRRGEVLSNTDLVPTVAGTFVTTLRLTPVTVAGRVKHTNVHRVEPWSTRRKVAVFGTLACLAAAVVVVALVWPLPAALAGAVLVAAAWLWRRHELNHPAPVPHVAIDHNDYRTARH